MARRLRQSTGCRIAQKSLEPRHRTSRSGLRDVFNLRHVLVGYQFDEFDELAPIGPVQRVPGHRQEVADSRGSDIGPRFDVGDTGEPCPSVFDAVRVRRRRTVVAPKSGRRSDSYGGEQTDEAAHSAEELVLLLDFTVLLDLITEAPKNISCITLNDIQRATFITSHHIS
jgi:hypothetical protein